jgi:uncharacterized protein (DUF1015 family)
LGQRAGESAQLKDSKLAGVYPFPAIRYNERVVEDLGTIVCPPYDVISAEQQKIYYERDDHNAIRLEYPMEQPGDNTERNKYTRAASTFQKWLEDGVLQVDDHLTFYVDDHYFIHMGERRRRRGLITRVRLEPWYRGIYPHEETYSKAKSDRLQLMRACHASFSSILALYQDSTRGVAELLSELVRDKPIIECHSEQSEAISLGESHRIWAMTESRSIRRITELLTDAPLYVADGHHRYETALAYQEERMPQVGTFTGNEGFNYIMMELVDFNDPGITILPIHRLLRGATISSLAELRSELEHVFAVESIPLSEGSISNLKGKVPGEPVLGILGLELDRLLILREREDVSIEGMMPDNRSQAYRKLDTSILNHLVLHRMLGFVESDGEIAYTVDIEEAWQAIAEGKYQLAFLLSEPRVDVIKAIADAKDRMPRKSTYFYPKLPAGLIINSVD